MNQGIPWDRLTDPELDFLQEVGVEMLPNGMKFSHEPTWDEFTVAFAYIIAIQARSLPDEEEINWAIGDCLNEGGRYFGEDKVDSWLQEFLELRAVRDLTLGMAGGTLVLLQQVEDAIKLCVAALDIKGIDLTIADLLSDDPSRRRKTLGQLAKALKITGAFSEEFVDRLDKFVGMRNTFVHNLWIETPKKYPKGQGLPPSEEFEEIGKFISRLTGEAFYFDGVFRGFRYELTKAIAHGGNSGAEESLPIEQWGKYIAEFQQVLRKSANGDLREAQPPNNSLERTGDSAAEARDD